MSVYSSTPVMEMDCTLLAEYIIDEFKSYGLEFNFNEPTVVCTDRYGPRHATIYLQGASLPQDCYRSDQNVVSKFVLKTILNFLKTEDLENKLKPVYISCTIDEKTNVIPFFVNIELSEKLEWKL